LKNIKEQCNRIFELDIEKGMWRIKGRINWHEKEEYLKKIRERK